MNATANDYRLRLLILKLLDTTFMWWMNKR